MILSIHLTLGNIITFFIGLFTGIVTATSIIIKRKKKILLKKEYEKISNEELIKLNTLIKKVFKYHQNSKKKYNKYLFGTIKVKREIDYYALSKKYLGYEFNSELSLLKEMFYIVKINATKLNPDKTYPLFELSIDDMFKTIFDVIDLFYDLIDALGIPSIEDIKLSEFYYIYLTYGNISKIIKNRKIKVLIWFTNLFLKISNFFNPVYWIKKGTSSLSSDSIIQTIYYSLFEIVAIVSFNIYKK